MESPNYSMFQLPYGSPRKSLWAAQHLWYLYDSPSRAYHNVGHIRHCLDELQDLKIEVFSPVRFAILYHDAIYDPMISNNEQRSADWAEADLRMLGAPDAVTEAVRRLILATSHRQYPNDLPDEKLIVDIDLAILGGDSQAYQGYYQAIRSEYAHVDDYGYKRGRIKFLEILLARPQIYQTDFFRGRYEEIARINTAKEIEQLSM